MTNDELLTACKTILADSRYDEALPTYLSAAESVVTSWLFPFDEEKEWEDVPERYHWRTCEIAAYLVAKQGAEGETRHVENGTTREWAKASVPVEMLMDMVPFAGVPE